MSTLLNSLQKVPTQRMASGFADVLESFRFESLEATSDPAFALKGTTHSLCKTCFAYYYGFLQPALDGK